MTWLEVLGALEVCPQKVVLLPLEFWEGCFKKEQAWPHPVLCLKSWSRIATVIGICHLPSLTRTEPIQAPGPWTSQIVSWINLFFFISSLHQVFPCIDEKQTKTHCAGDALGVSEWHGVAGTGGYSHHTLPPPFLLTPSRTVKEVLWVLGVNHCSPLPLCTSGIGTLQAMANETWRESWWSVGVGKDFSPC
jgi:hypothetical protein